MAKQLDWEQVLLEGYEPLRKAQKLFRRLPHDPRCRMCLSPFSGVGGRVFGWMGRTPSRKNPNLCTACFDHLPEGGLELDVGILFADVRGSTSMGERSSATEFAGRLNRFYATATKVLVDHNGMIDKLIGDEVMAIFLPGLAGDDYRRTTALAAVELARALGDVPVGVAVNAGTAFVGKVGTGPIVDFTALGDAVNVAARLQSHAQDGQVVLAAELYDLIEAQHPGAVRSRIDVRGRDEQVDVAVLTP
ncbi:MAG TPA: adenylate/guanylate cyclase domain-containing protein [Acidimicrobiales bacterium]|nr:adenylate/guanylate cyclase domain-containing protein [Acidimicrobiales bacterium]